jgi:hypothetical protein
MSIDQYLTRSAKPYHGMWKGRADKRIASKAVRQKRLPSELLDHKIESREDENHHLDQIANDDFQDDDYEYDYRAERDWEEYQRGIENDRYMEEQYRLDYYSDDSTWDWDD